MGVQRGSLPKRYLGVPLAFKRMHISNYRPLMIRSSAELLTGNLDSCQMQGGRYY